MKPNELRDMSVVELEEKLVQLRTEMAKERATIASGTRAEKPAKIGNLRKDIARILTIMNQKSRAKAAEAKEEAK